MSDKIRANVLTTAEVRRALQQINQVMTTKKYVLGPATTTEDKVPQWSATTRTLKDGLTVKTTLADPGVDTAVATEKAIRSAIAAAVHPRQHSIISTLDHTSAATAGRMLKADANGLPVEATNTDAEVSGVVSGAVYKSLFDVQTILAATADNTPAALTINEQNLVGRITGGNIASLSQAQVHTLLFGSNSVNENITLADGKDLLPAVNVTSDIGDPTHCFQSIYASHLSLRKTASPLDAPELHFYGFTGSWLMGIDVANHGGGADFVLAARVNGATVDDIIYLNWGTGSDAVSIGLGYTPPPGNSYRTYIAALDSATTMGELSLRVGPSQTGHAWVVTDSNPVDKLWCRADFYLQSALAAGLSIKANSSDYVLSLERYASAVNYGFLFSGDSLRLRYNTGGVDMLTFATTGAATLHQFFNIGTTTLATAQGDLAAGLTGGAQLLYDQSDHVLKLVNSAGVLNAQINELTGAANYGGIWFGNIAGGAAGTYSLLGEGTNTFVNAATGGTVYHRINNVDIMTMTATGLTLAAGTSVSSPTIYVDHIAEKTGAHTITFDNNVTMTAAKDLLAGATTCDIGTYDAPFGTITGSSLIARAADSTGGYNYFDAYSSINTYDCSNFYFRRGRGTKASPAAVGDADFLGAVDFAGYQAGWSIGAAIVALANGAWDGTTHSAILQLKGTPYGSTTLAAVCGIDGSAIYMYSGKHIKSWYAAGTSDIGDATYNFRNGYFAKHYVDHIGEFTAAHAVIFDSIVKLGDSTNYAQFAADGELTLAGTARVRKTIVLANAFLGKGTSAPDQVVIGNYTAWEFDLNDDCVITHGVPKDWAVGTDITIELSWYINEAYATNSGEVKWRVDWSMCPHDGTEAIDAPTHTGNGDTGDLNIPATAKRLSENVAVTIAAASIALGDEIGIKLSRVALTGGNNPTAKPSVIHVYIRYTADKLGTAT